MSEPTGPATAVDVVEQAEPTTLEERVDALRRRILELSAASKVGERRAAAEGIDQELEELRLELGNLERAAAAAAAAPRGFVQRLADAFLEAGQVTKSSTNVDQGYKFASAEAILGAVRRPLFERGIILTAHPRTYDEQEIRSRGGSQGTRIVVSLDYTFRADDGELTIEDWRGDGQDFGDKAIGKAYTNAHKTFVRGQWLLPTEHDDPEASPSGERVPRSDVPNTLEPALPPWAHPASPNAYGKVAAGLEGSIGLENTDKLLDDLRKFAGGEVPAAAARALLAYMALLERAGVIEKRATPTAEELKAAQDRAAEAGDPPAPDPAPDPEPVDDGVIPTEASRRAAERSRAAAAAMRSDVDAEAAQATLLPAGEPGDPLPGDEIPPPGAGIPEDAPPPDPNAPAPGTVKVDLTGLDLGDVDQRNQAGATLRGAGCICPDPIQTHEAGDSAGLNAAAKTDENCPVHGIPF